MSATEMPWRPPIFLRVLSEASTQADCDNCLPYVDKLVPPVESVDAAFIRSVTRSAFKTEARDFLEEGDTPR